MLAIIDKRAPKEAVLCLKKQVGDVFQFESIGLTSDSISGHPDIFIYQDESNLIIAPNAPLPLLDFLNFHKVDYVFGEKKIEKNFENSVSYNCIGTEHYFFHKTGFTDPVILKLNRNKEFINLPQAFTRCSLTHLGNKNFITSDKGIEKKLIKKGLNCFYFSPEQISIIGHKHGFLGGTCGLYNNKLLFIGTIDMHQQGIALRNYIEGSGIEIVSLTNSLLYDGGGIFFIKKKQTQYLSNRPILP